MKTLWTGFGIPPDNCVSTDFFFQRQMGVTLQDPPQLVTRVTLSPQSHAVNLWCWESSVLYAVDIDPGPYMPPSMGALIPVTDFRPGGIVMPNSWHQCVLPLDGLTHYLHLVSDAPYTRIWIVMLEEGL